MFGIEYVANFLKSYWIRFTYIIFGILLSLFIRNFASRNSKSETKDINQPVYRFYLNIFFLNTKDVLKNIVNSKFSKRAPLLRAVAKSFAVNLVKDEVLASKIGNELCTAIPKRIYLSGVQAEATMIYQKSSFICIEVKLLSIDPIIFISKMTRYTLEIEALYNKLSSLFGFKYIESYLHASLLMFVGKKMLTKLPELLIDNLRTKMSAEVEIITLPEEEQTTFLVDTIQELNNDSNNSNNNIISTTTTINNNNVSNITNNGTAF